MSEEPNFNEEVKQVEKRFSRFLNVTRNKYFNRKIIVPALILLAIPLTIGLVLVQQNVRSRAGGGLPIASVAINPGIITASVAAGTKLPAPIALSALAYDTQGNPINYGINYDWSISSTDTIGTLTKTEGVISQFKPYKAGCGVLNVTATYGGRSMTKSASIVVRDGNIVPTCAQGVPLPFSWKTNEVTLMADSFYIQIGGKIFATPNSNNVTSTPAYYDKTDGYYHTDIDGIWKENGTEMRLFMDFRYTPGDFWKLDHIKTYSGTGASWIDYPHGDIMNSLGDSYIGGNLDLQGSNQTVSRASIHFGNIKLKPFFSMITPTPTQCVRAKPFITNIEPLDGTRKVTSAQTTFYKFWVRNDNSTTCPPTSYRIVINNKNQYITTQAEGDFTLKSGESRDTIVNATVLKGAPLSSNQINVAVWDVYNVSKPESSTNVNLTITDIVTPSPFTQKVTIVPIADSFVKSSAPTSNFGSAKTVETDTNPNEVSYFKFNLKALAGKKIVSAMLVLKANDASGQTQNVKRADDTAWTEGGINYNNRPKLVTHVNSFVPKTVGGTVSVNVLGPVMVKKGENLTLGINSTTGNDKAVYYSRESAYQPQLVIEYQ